MYDFSGAIIGAMMVAAVVAALVTLAGVFGLPVLWEWLKPLLHALTA
jgi:hypothetical protein